jgi:ACS family glucarate transporter-like MFS transporter
MAATARPTRVRWLILFLICLASFVAYILRTNLSVAGEAMIRDLGLSELQLGLVLSAFAWGYGLLQLPGGVMGEHLGARRSMILLALAWGGLTLLTGLVPGTRLVSPLLCLGALLVLRFLMGVAQAPLYPVTGGISTAVWFPITTWAFVNGLTTTTMTLGAAASGPGVAWLALTLGWRNSFVVAAPLGFLVAGLWWWIYRDDPAQHPGVGSEELSRIRAGRSDAAGERARISWTAVLAHRDVLALTASYFCMNYVFYLFFNWFYYYLVTVRRLPEQVGGYFLAAQWMVGSIAASLGGWLCDRLSLRFGRRIGCRLTAMGGLLACAPLLVAGARASDPMVAVALLSLSFGATQLTDGAFWAAAMRIGGPHAAAATGLMNTGGNVVGGIGAILVPLVARGFGWVAALSTGAIFGVAGALLWLGVRADVSMGHPRPAARAGEPCGGTVGGAAGGRR